MCKSVPQIEAVRTRTSTSAAPIKGTDAVSNESPRAACILRKAFIVDGMESGSWWDAIRNRSTPPACRALRGLRGRDAAPLRPGLARLKARPSPLYRASSSLTSRVPQRRSSRALANTPAISPPAPARTPPKPHREFPAYCVSHSRNSALRTRTLLRCPRALGSSATLEWRHQPLSHARQNSHSQTPPADLVDPRVA